MTQDLKKLTAQALDDALIVDYLQENLDFFQKHPQLLAEMQVTHGPRGAISLVERQQQVLRQRIHQLEDEITELMVNARRNEDIFRRYSQLYVRLLSSTSLTEVSNHLQKTFHEELNLAALKLKFFDTSLKLPAAHTFTADTHKQLLSKRFVDSSLYLGRLTDAEQRLLFPNESIQSVALMLLGDDGDLGLLAIGSQDPGHFEPAMDKLLVGQLQALLGAVLPPLVAHGAL